MKSSLVLKVELNGRVILQTPVEHEISIGRSPRCDVHIDADRVSRKHATLTRSDSGLLLADEGSRNGTFVNGQRVESTGVSTGDQINIGPFTLELIENSPTPSLSTTSISDASVEDSICLLRSIDIDSQIATEASDHARAALHLRTFRDVAMLLAGALDRDVLLERILDSLFRAYPGATHGFIMLYNDTKELQPVAERRRDTDDAETITISRTVVSQVSRERRAILYNSDLTDLDPNAIKSLDAHDIRSMLCAPLATASNTLGIVHLDSSDSALPFAPDDLNLLVGIAAQASIALENVELYERQVRDQRLAAVGQAVAGLAHCIKNILNGVQGGSFIVDKGLESGDTEMVHQGWDIVTRNNKFMSGLALDMLSYAKERKPVLKPTDVNALCQDVCEMVSDTAGQKSVTVKFSRMEDAGPVPLDDNALRRALLNLVSNAVDACEDASGNVSVTAQLDNEWLVIQVADNGPGIPEEHLPRLFDAFFSTKGSKGTGLGLAVTAKIIQEHEGTITVESTAGSGTTFIITLPRHN